MRGVMAACLVLLLAAEASIAQDCVLKPADAEGDNLNCISDDNACENFFDDCDCVPYYLCSDNSTVGGEVDLVHIRSIGADPADGCSTLDTCCPKANQMQVNNDNTGPNGGNPPNTGPNGGNPSNTGPNGGNPPSFPATPKLGCGQRNKAGVGFRIVGNNDGEAQFGEFPWMVALLEIDNGVEKFIGGGSLIHPQVVLTAAHSVMRYLKDLSKLRVRAGEWDTQSDSEMVKYQQLEVSEVFMHEKFFLGGLYNDIALLVLHEELDEADNVGMLCMPEQGVTSTSSECVATGWGKSTFGNSACYQVILKSILLPMVQRNQCEKMLRKTRLGGKFILHNSFTCAGGKGGKDACKGDGGGPLACPIPGDEEFYEQGGIVAWGIGCGDVGVPGVYTDVAQFRNWVDQKFDELGFQTEFYQRPSTAK